jgi:hypothetical protein
METMKAVVSALVHEFHFVQLEAEDGETTLCIGKRTEGVDWRMLELGQRLICEVDTQNMARVVRARLLE